MTKIVVRKTNRIVPRSYPMKLIVTGVNERNKKVSVTVIKSDNKTAKLLRLFFRL